MNGSKFGDSSVFFSKGANGTVVNTEPSALRSCREILVDACGNREAFANPFVCNPAPNCQFPGQPAGWKVGQANLEEGDPIQVLPNATATVEIKEKGFHFFQQPQNIPLLQWFEMGTTSSAIDGAFSSPTKPCSRTLPSSARSSSQADGEFGVVDEGQILYSWTSDICLDRRKGRALLLGLFSSLVGCQDVVETSATPVFL
jgi:hypothetical protein